MDIDTNPSALFMPGEAEDFFAEFGAIRRFDPEAADFSLTNACWLAELSRLVYCSGSDEQRERRAKHLASVDLVERKFIDSDLAHAAIVESIRGPRFRAVIFRGTAVGGDVVTDLNALPVRWIEGDGLVHAGFAAAFRSLDGAIERALPDDGVPLFLTGHSLGAALATLFGARRDTVRVHTIYTFGSPRVGDPAFRHSLNEIPCWRVRNHLDVVTAVPTPPLFRHVGSRVHLGSGGLVRVRIDNEDVVHQRGVDEDGDEALPPETVSARARGLFSMMTRIASKNVSSLSGIIPAFLTDHAPVNYVARLVNAQAAERSGT